MNISLLNSMLADDGGRLWISTITEKSKVYEWWVLEPNGEVIAKFDWPSEEPIEEIKNGKMYSRKTMKGSVWKKLCDMIL